MFEAHVQDRLTGDVIVRAPSISGGGSFIVDLLNTSADVRPAGLGVDFYATADVFEVDFFKAQQTLGGILRGSVDSSAALGGIARFSTCPDDHPVLRSGWPLTDGPCYSPDGESSFIAQTCVTLDAQINIRARSARICESPQVDDTACGERLEVDITVAPTSGAPFSGTLSLRHEIDIGHRSCGAI